MKRLTAMILVGAMLTSATACGNATAKSAAEASATTAMVETESIAESGNEPENVTETSIEESESETSEEEKIDDAAWDELAALGSVQTDSGLFTVSMTLPTELVGEDVSQESLNQGAPEKYVSATLNEDGSVTYVLTKRQHKEMMDAMVTSMDEALQEMASSTDYQFREIRHNEDFTHFDVYLEAEELGFNETIAMLALYIYGGMYGIFIGKTPEHVTVSCYDKDSNLIDTYDSADMEG